MYAYFSTITLKNEQNMYEWKVNGKTIIRNMDHIPDLAHGNGWCPLEENCVETLWYTKTHLLMRTLSVEHCSIMDKLLSWRLNTVPKCIICNVSLESKNYIFFACPFSWEIWRHVSARCRILPAQNEIFLSLWLSVHRSFPLNKRWSSLFGKALSISCGLNTVSYYVEATSNRRKRFWNWWTQQSGTV